MTVHKSKPLRFAAYIRVSTESQEREGASLQVQKEQVRAAVERLDGEIVASFGGQEHATAGWDRAQFDYLLKGAEQGRFDAVMIPDLSRWSRDNRRSKKDLELLRKAGIRFFVLSTEFDLRNSSHRFIVGMTTETNEFFASIQAEKAILSRIERARRGGWTVGNPPPGRSLDKKTQQWSVDEEFRACVELMAQDYLENDIGFVELARKYGFGSPFRAHKVLTKCAGASFEQRFQLESAGIDEIVVTKVPRLLSDEIIERIQQKAKARRTYIHRHQNHFYLLSRNIMDARTGQSMTGTTNDKAKKVRVYRPFNLPPGVKSFSILADALEYAVSSTLGKFFADDQAFMQAVLDGHNSSEDRAQELMEKIKRLRRALGNRKRERKRVVGSIARGTMSDQDAQEWFDENKTHVTLLEDDLSRTEHELARLPSEKELQRQRKEAVQLLKSSVRKPSAADVRLGAVQSHLRSGVGLSKEVTNLIFGGEDPYGRRYGVYVYPHLDGPTRWFEFEAYGKLGTLSGRLDHFDPEPYDIEWRGEPGATTREVQDQFAGEFDDKTTFVRPGPGRSPRAGRSGRKSPPAGH